MKLSTLFLSALLLSSCHSTGAAPAADNPMAVKPGPEHGLLHMMAGKWDAEVHMEGSEPEKGTSVSRVALNGLWLETEYEGQMMGSAFVGHDRVGYDTFRKVYVGSWIDNWSSYMVTTEGTYDAASRTLTMQGMTIDPMSGGMVPVVNVTKFVDDDHMVFAMHMGGAEAPAAMTIHYRRR